MPPRSGHGSPGSASGRGAWPPRRGVLRARASGGPGSAPSRRPWGGRAWACQRRQASTAPVRSGPPEAPEDDPVCSRIYVYARQAIPVYGEFVPIDDRAGLGGACATSSAGGRPPPPRDAARSRCRSSRGCSPDASRSMSLFSEACPSIHRLRHPHNAIIILEPARPQASGRRIPWRRHHQGEA